MGPRNSGIDLIGEVPWGTHLCQFYSTESDLLEIILPYINAGLRSNELCMWVASGKEQAASALAALERHVPDFNNRLAAGQIRVVSHEDWYLSGGGFDPERVLKGWAEMHETALRDGFDGMRVTGNTFWVEKKDWKRFSDYERAVQGAIGKLRMIALCTYSLGACGAAEVMDVASSHGHTLIKKEGDWAVIESAERRLALDELRRSERRYRDLVELTSDLVFRMSIRPGGALDLEWITESFEEISGYGPWDISSFESLERIFHPEDAVKLKETLASALSGRRLEAGLRYYTRAQELRWLRLQLIPEYHEGTRIIRGVVCKGNDITAVKEAEQRLLDEMSLSEGLIESLPGTFYVIDDNTKLVRWNGNLETLSGYTSAEIARMHPVDFFPPAQRPLIKEKIAEVFSSESVEVEATLLTKSGELIPFLFRARLFRKDGRPFIVGIGLDIAERNRAEELLRKAGRELESKVEERTVELKQMNSRLRASEERFRTLVETTSDWVWEVDASGVYTYVSPKVMDMLGYRPDEALGRTLFDFMPADEAERVRATFVGIAALKKPFALLENRNCHKDGREVILETNGAPIMNQAGELLGYRGIGRDISRRKFQEREREKMHDQLIQSQKMEAIGALAGGIAHDFNNLMVVIKLNSDLSMKRAGKDGEITPYLEQINAASERAENLTRQLLIFSRKQPTTVAALNLNTKVEKILGILKRLIGENIRIRTELDRDIKQIRADKVNIEQIVMNLVINARDAMPRGGLVTIRTDNVGIAGGESLRAASLEAGAYARLTVEDSGTGMESETIKRIFEPFFTTKGPMGTGLGLAVVHNIVKDLKGWIDVESKPGAGTRFEIYLPAVECAGKAEERRPVNEEPVGKGERVLVVEDEKLLRKSVSVVLAKNGYKVYEASSAREAISIFEREKGFFNLVFSDMVLKDNDGIRLVDHLRAIDPAGPDFKVLVTSGDLDVESQWPAIRARGFNFLQKPYEISDLLSSVRSALDK